MSMPLKWEFPGGKIHDGESAEECVIRELMEELGILVSIKRALTPVFHKYDYFAVELMPFVCVIAGGEIMLHEHRAVAWFYPGELPALDWPEADIPVIESYLALGR
jgi:8-oxo-dGTP diphosphatase